MRLLARLAIGLLAGTLVLAAGASSRPAAVTLAPPDLSRPQLVEPAPGQAFAPDAKFYFRARTHPGDERLFMYVSRSPAVADACGTIGDDVWMYALKPTGDPSVYATDYFASWTNTAGTYYWRAYRVEYREGGDGCIESEIRSLVIRAGAPKPQPTPTTPTQPAPQPKPKPKPEPPAALSAARLAGRFEVTSRLVSVSGIDIKVGTKDSGTWRFAPVCSRGACDVRLTYSHRGASFDKHVARVRLDRNGAVYSGTTTTPLTECSSADVPGTLSIRLRVTRGAWIGGFWRAIRFTGSYRYSAPASRSGIYRCPAALLRAALSGQLE